jgi:hypothetical protein
MKLATHTQQFIEVDVAFYDEHEKRKLLAYPSGKRMEEIVAEPIRIPMAEFLTYYLFYRKRLGIPSYSDYGTIGRKTESALAAIDECLDFNGKSVCTPAGAIRQLNEVSEHVPERVLRQVRFDHEHGPALKFHNFAAVTEPFTSHLAAM